jgi:hypothetical protein
MSNSLPIPGPWSVSPHNPGEVRAPYKNGWRNVAVVAEDHTDVTEEEKATAILIAAAPDLFEALMYALEMLAMKPSQSGG